MNPRHGEVWLVDMGIAGKTRPAIVLIADALNVPRTLIIHIPITRQNRGSELEIPPVQSAETAVRASIVADGKKEWKQ